MKIAIIGGGVGGLVIGYRMAQKGHRVVIYEKKNFLGGLMAGEKQGNIFLEKTYHHIFKSDKYAIKLIEELGFKNKLKWHKSSMAIYWQGKFYPFVTPKDLLTFEPLNIFDKFRLGLVTLYLQKTNKWKKFENIEAYKWMEKWCGKRAYQVIWEPLLRGKFHDFYKEVSMAWLWARIHVRANSKEKGESEEKLGYLHGGFQQITEKLAREIVRMGGEVKTGVEIKSFGEIKADRIIATVPNQPLAKAFNNKIYPKLHRKLTAVNYLGAINVVFESQQNLSEYYWHNINDLNSPFLAFIQHTNLVGRTEYGGNNIYYLGTYVPHDHRYFELDDKEIIIEFTQYLKRIFPEFDIDKARNIRVCKLKFAQQVVTKNYSAKLIPRKLPIKNVYLSNFAQIYPEDRGINYAIREAEKMVGFLGLK
ncbi:MAG: NAD(P)/FAD-dependent oxidoreductase [Candidatus Shapirobacteria bacterium]|jgi:protoporphyrinogen oxidase